MKRNETKQQEQKNQAQQKNQQPVIRVQSRVRAGLLAPIDGGGGCCPPI
jgi:hypothetical protein